MTIHGHHSIFLIFCNRKVVEIPIGLSFTFFDIKRPASGAQLARGKLPSVLKQENVVLLHPQTLAFIPKMVS